MFICVLLFVIADCFCFLIDIHQCTDSSPLEATPSSVNNEDKRIIEPRLLNRVRRYFEEKMTAFMQRIRSDTLRFLPSVDYVTIENSDLITNLRAKNAYAVSWSNVCDYISPIDFHRVARALSGSETVHYVHSCNWITTIYGTDIFEINEMVRMDFYQAGMNMLTMANRFYGLSEPPITHFRNICTAVLGRRYVYNWMEYFFEGQDDVQVATAGTLTCTYPTIL
jgi:hypothetical protein